jgi:hypothetical protein
MKDKNRKNEPATEAKVTLGQPDKDNRGSYSQ